VTRNVTWQVANATKLVAYVVVVTTHVISLDGDAIKLNRCINCVDSQIIWNTEFTPLDWNMPITSPS
jgi:hypothetical protein